MNSDIRLQVSFLNHRKRKKLFASLGAEGIVSLIDLWLSAAQSRPRGILIDMTEADIALDAGWSGDPVKFCESLKDAGFLDQAEDGTYSLHNWSRRQAFVYYSSERSEKARKAAEARWDGKNKGRSVGSGKRPKKIFAEDSEPFLLAVHLYERIKSRLPEFGKKDLQKWALYIDLMIRVDGRDPDHIAKVIDWCQQDTFWRQNILSTENLRKQFDSLIARMEGK